MAPNRTAALVVVCLLALAEVQRAEARKRKQPSGHRGEQELDEFSGDSYAEFVDKYYKSSSSEPGQRLSGSSVGGRYY